MTTIGDFRLIKSLGSGAFSKVKLAENVTTGEKCALKIMKKEKSSKSSKIKNLFMNETNALKECSHENILRLVDFSEHAIARRSDSKTMSVAYIALEYAENGEIFDFISESGRFTEPVSRFYFKQLIDALDALNSKGYCHRDIKPENILLDSNFNLKLASIFISQLQVVKLS